MRRYLLHRLSLLPLTLFAIIFINFLILNLAPLEPVAGLNRTPLDEASKSTEAGVGAVDEQYLNFREHYGLTLPIFFNSWPLLSEEKIKKELESLLGLKTSSFIDYRAGIIRWGDRARFIMHPLLKIAKESENSFLLRQLAVNLIVRGGTRQGFVGPVLSEKEKALNREIGASNSFLYDKKASIEGVEAMETKINALQSWLEKNSALFPEKFSPLEKVSIAFFETRFFRYLSKVVTFDFGTIRTDQNKRVSTEVANRLKVSFALSITPLVLAFFASLLLGMLMALYQNRLLDITLNTFFLILFTIPAFVVAPFLIEKLALHKNFPFTHFPMPIGGFHSEEKLYAHMTSLERLGDTLRHLMLPLLAILYSSLSLQSRLARTAIIHVMNQEHVKTALAKGLPFLTVLKRHVARNALIPLVTSVASSLGVILGGALIVETVFEINGFGRFFYDAIVNRDYNVILFSAFAGSLLTLVGYLMADIIYTILDPRVGFEKQEV